MRLVVIVVALTLSASGITASPRYSEPVRSVQYEFVVDSRPVFVRVEAVGRPPKQA